MTPKASYASFGQASFLTSASRASSSAGLSTMTEEPQPWQPATTYNSLTYEPSQSNASIHSTSSRRRPSLPSVIEKAVHPGQTFRQALGTLQNQHAHSSRPPPLSLASSTSDAFNTNDAYSHQQTERQRKSSTGSSKLASVFGKRLSGASLKSPSLSSPRDEAPPHDFEPSEHHAAEADEDDLTGASHSVPPAGSVNDAYSKLEGRPATAPATRTTFPISSAADTPANAAETPLPPSPQSSNAAVYRSRNSSLMSENSVNAGSIEQALEQGAPNEHPRPSLSAMPSTASGPARHKRSASNESWSPSSSIYSFGPGAAAGLGTHHDATSPSLKSDGSSHMGFSTDAQHESQTTAPSEEARDSIPALHSQPVYKPRSGSRLRADSTGSNSSNASLYSGRSPYAVHTHSPLGSQAGSHDRLPLTSMPEHTDHAAPVMPSYSTRPRRSGSGSETGLRHLVLSTQPSHAMSVSPTSPTSVSSWSGSNYLGSSQASTRATSDSHQGMGPSVRDPPASPRKVYRNNITPEIAHSLVREAQQSLLQYDSRDAASQPSLSQQLAAYGDRITLEEEVNKRRLAPAPPGAAPQSARAQKYQWERLDQFGNHMPLPQSSSDNYAGASRQNQPRRADPYQQGNLDVRRPEAPTLRRPQPSSELYRPQNPLVHSDERLTASSPRLEIPPAVDPRLALRSQVNKIYDHRATAMSSQRPPKASLQYTILGSNPPHHIAPPGRSGSRTPSGRRSPSSVDDPVRSGALQSSTTSSTSSQAPSITGARSSRGKSSSTPSGQQHKPRQASGGGGGVSSDSSPTRSAATVPAASSGGNEAESSGKNQQQKPLSLETPTAPRKTYEPVSGFGGLNMEGSEGRKGLFAKGFNKLRHGF